MLSFSLAEGLGAADPAAQQRPAGAGARAGARGAGAPEGLGLGSLNLMYGVGFVYELGLEASTLAIDGHIFSVSWGLGVVS